MKEYIVYKHTNKINQKVYIGLTCQNLNDRWRLGGKGYKGQSKFWNAIQYYGWDNFSHEIIATNLSKDEAGILEKKLIKEYDAIENGYNIELGGNHKQHSPETIEKIRNSMYGHYHTQETKEKISLHKQEAKKPVICFETGKEYESLKAASIDTNTDCSSISKVCNGTMKSAGGYHWYWKGQNPNIKKDSRFKSVKCLTTGKIYATVSEAAKDTKSDPSNIIKVCNGKYKSTNKLKWSYYDEED